MVSFSTKVANFTWTCTKQITLLPTSTEELSIPPALSFTKDQTQEIKSTSKSKSRKINSGVNNDVKMDRGPVIFTSDVSLPKDNKSASEVNKSQLGKCQDYEGTAMLTMQQRKEGLKSNGQYAKVSRPKSICIYYESSTLRYLSRTSRWYYVANPTQSVNSMQQTTALEELCIK